MKNSRSNTKCNHPTLSDSAFDIVWKDGKAIRGNAKNPMTIETMNDISKRNSIRIYECPLLYAMSYIDACENLSIIHETPLKFVDISKNGNYHCDMGSIRNLRILTSKVNSVRFGNGNNIGSLNLVGIIDGINFGMRYDINAKCNYMFSYNCAYILDNCKIGVMYLTNSMILGSYTANMIDIKCNIFAFDI